MRLTNSIRRKDNLTSGERKALSKLRARTDVIIKPADKGSATVVMSKEDYVAEARRQLSDSSITTSLRKTPTQEFAAQLTGLVCEMANDGHIDEDTKEYPTLSNPRTAWFYHLPKIHKPTVPGRPTVSSC